MDEEGRPDLIWTLAFIMNGAQRPGRRMVAAPGGAMTAGGGSLD
jgi:hypothetical protein